MWLLFKMNLKSSTKLLEGTLSVMEETGAPTVAFRAASGLAKWQRKADQSTKNRGPIPGCQSVGISSYSVVTKGINQPNTEGIKGLFYHITPDPVKVGSVNRDQFGIHFDAGTLGSAGCIVLLDKAAWS